MRQFIKPSFYMLWYLLEPCSIRRLVVKLLCTHRNVYGDLDPKCFGRTCTMLANTCFRHPVAFFALVAFSFVGKWKVRFYVASWHIFIPSSYAILQMDDRTTMAAKLMLWSDESMQATVDSILHDNRGLREAARLYNIPVETLRRHVNVV